MCGVKISTGRLSNFEGVELNVWRQHEYRKVKLFRRCGDECVALSTGRLSNFEGVKMTLWRYDEYRKVK